MLLQNSFAQYKANSKTALVFALLGVFVLLFSSFENVFVSSGSIFLEYNIATVAQPLLLAEAGMIALYLLFYSFFVSIMVFSVRRNLSKLKMHFYLREMIQRFTLRIFVFYVLYCLVLFALTTALLSLGVSIILIGLLLLILTFVSLFVPQAVVVDEEGLRHALLSNAEFLLKHPRSFLVVAVIGAALLAIVQLVEFAVDQFALVGAYVSLFLLLVFVLPFLEVMKTYLYMLRFDLIKRHEIAQGKKPLVLPQEPGSLAAAAAKK